MYSHSGMRLCMAAVLTMLTGIASFPAQSEETIMGKVIPSEPGVNEVIGRILDDPQRDYASAQGPDDCNSEELYLGTKTALGNYVANPAGQQAAMQDYILSGREPCNCTRAIVGKYIDDLVKELGMDMSHLPCL